MNKVVFPKDMPYPLSDDLLDIMIEHWSNILTAPSVEWYNRVDICTLALLLELKERRNNGSRIL